MTMRNFIKKNREELDAHIKMICPNCKLNNNERESWIYNDEDLYRWARMEGVRI